MIPSHWRIFPCHSVVNGRCSCGKPDCDSPGKHPRTKRGVKDAVPASPAGLAKWKNKWGGKINWAVSTGAGSGLLVVDTDIKADVNGEEALAQLAREHGDLPDTVRSITGGGGRHRYFRYPEQGPAIGNRTGILPRGIDIRGEGGYVLLPPSKHLSGRPYEWVFHHDPKHLEPAECPEWLLQLILTDPTPPPPPRRTPSAPRGPWPAGTGTPYGIRALDDEITAISSAPEGGRNHQLNRSAYALGQLVAGGELVQDQVEQALFDAADRAGLSEREAKKTIKSGLKSGQQQPRSAPPSDRKGPPPPKDEDAPPFSGSPEPDRAFICQKGQGHLAVDFAIRQLAQDETIWQRSGRLVTVRTDRGPAGKILREETPVISPIPRSVLWSELSRIVTWRRWDQRSQHELPCDPPGNVVTAVHEAGSWSGVPVLRGLTSAPMLRPDGSVRTDSGYDPETGYYYFSSGKAPKIPDRPTRDDAVRAMAELAMVVEDVPFAGQGDLSGWLAGVLTPLARHLSPCVPAFVFDASTSGSGKSLLADTVAIITTGKPAVRSPFTSDDDELRKRILAHALAGDQLVLIDNCPNGWIVGWPSLDGALTGEEIEDRLLGESTKVRLPNTMTVFLTGNNLSVKTDTGRRVLRVRIEPDCARPEERIGFVHPDLRAWVRADRPRLLGAALTILAAYLREQCPEVGVSPLGSFEQWSGLVASAIVWSGGANPIDLLASRSDCSDPELTAIAALLEAWSRYEAMTIATAIATSRTDPAMERAMIELTGGELPDSRKLGYRLRAVKDRWFSLSDGSQAQLVKSPGSGGKGSWSVRLREADSGGGSCYNCDPFLQRARSVKEDNIIKGQKNGSGGQDRNYRNYHNPSQLPLGGGPTVTIDLSGLPAEGKH